MDGGAADADHVMDVIDTDNDYWSDYWTLLRVNRSRTSEMVSQSGRISILVFGALLAVWGLCLHIGIFYLVFRRRKVSRTNPTHGRNSPLHWLLVSSSLGQVGMIAFVLPIELLTEYHGGWTLGRSFCQWWRPIHIGLIALYFWGHFAITVERYLRCVRSYSCYKGGDCRAVITGFSVVTSWMVSFVCAAVVTIVMRRHDALQDDVCAMSMSVNMAFVLSFTVYFTPVALTIAASAALLVVRCQNPATTMYSPRVRTLPITDHTRDPARRLAKSPGNGSISSLESREKGNTPERSCASALLITSADADTSVMDTNNSITVAMIANVIAITCWMPFYVTNLVIPFCNTVCVDPTLWTLFLWFGYSSVGLSPIVWFFEPTIRAEARSVVG